MKYWYDRRGVLCDRNGAVLGSIEIEKAKKALKEEEKAKQELVNILWK